MSPTLRFTVAVLTTAILADACSSAPTRFYTLQGAPLTPATSAGAPFQIEVLPVTIPAEVDQPALVLRKSDGELALFDNDQWVAPLADQIRGAVAARLSAKLGSEDVSSLIRPPGSPVYRIQLVVRQFESIFAQSISISVGWSIQSPAPSKGVLTCTSQVTEAVPAGGKADLEALVVAHQRGIAEISNVIAASISKLQAAGSVDCP